MKTEETVTVAGSESTSLAVVFQPLPKSEKGPIYRVLIALPRPLANVVAEGAIFAERDKAGAQTGISVSLGGSSRFPVFKAAKATIDANGKTYRLQDDNPEGLRVLGALDAGIKTAFHAMLTSGNAEQRIAL